MQGLLTCTSCEGSETPAISLFLHVLVLTAQSQATASEGKLAGRACRTAVMCGNAAGSASGSSYSSRQTMRRRSGLMLQHYQQP